MKLKKARLHHDVDRDFSGRVQLASLTLGVPLLVHPLGVVVVGGTGTLAGVGVLLLLLVKLHEGQEADCRDERERGAPDEDPRLLVDDQHLADHPVEGNTGAHDERYGDAQQGDFQVHGIGSFVGCYSYLMIRSAALSIAYLRLWIPNRAAKP